MTAPSPLLWDIFRRLQQQGLGLSVGDYLEFLSALEIFPEPFDTLEGVRGSGEFGPSRPSPERRRLSRDTLSWLCQALWARDAREEQLIRRVISEEAPRADAEWSLLLTSALSTVGPMSDPGMFAPDPPPKPDLPSPKQDQKAAAEAQTEAPLRSRGDGAVHGETVGDELAPTQIEDDDEWAAWIHTEVAERGQASLPTAAHLKPPSFERFTMTEAPLMSSLWMTSVWRRLFQPRREVDLTRIDVDETVRYAARTGVIDHPRYATRATNTARLTVLFDSGRRMAPWSAFADAMRRTLQQGARLAQVDFFHFATMPGGRLFATEAMRLGESANAALSRNAGAPLLVFGEAGAMESNRRDLPDRLETFLAAARTAERRPIVWINPMPSDRWKASFKTRLSQEPHAHLLSLHQEALLRAVDILRGINT